MHESTHVETTVTTDEVLNVFEKHLKETGATATITTPPARGVYGATPTRQARCR